MTKKLRTVLLIVLILAMCMTLLVGCDEIFKKDEVRDAKQVVASVSYNGQTENIYKFELETYFNNNAYIYVNYYGMTYQAAAKACLESLAQQRLLAMFAKEKVAEMQGKEMPLNVEELLSSGDYGKALLTRSEYNKAIENANESLLSSLKSLIEDAVLEDMYNSGSDSDDSSSNQTEESGEITDAIFVRFNSEGGSAVERQRIQKGTNPKKPADPTKEGYTFYGWYEKDTNGELLDTEFDFNNDNGLDKGVILYAKWVEYTAPRTPIPSETESDDYDADIDDTSVEILDTFFSKDYTDGLYDKIKDEDFVKNIVVPKDSQGNPTKTEEEALKDYISDSLVDLKTNLKKNLYLDTAGKTDDELIAEGYQYYLKQQYNSLIVTKMQRLIEKSITVSEDEVKAEFNRIAKGNKEVFDSNESGYESALTATLNQTYFHAIEENNSYGFVINILFKLSDEETNELKTKYTELQGNETALKILRNRALSKFEVKISNPKYDAEAKVLNSETHKEITLRDPMTDPNNPFNKIGKTEENLQDKSYQAEGGNNYNQIVKFVFDEETKKYKIEFGATEHAAMAYLEETHPLFDVDGKTGILHQIYASLESVKAEINANRLTPEQGVYWLKKVANTWLYLVGDDSGAVSSNSNNNGLGYLVTPEGKKSNYLEEFTDYARNLIANGTGSYSVGNIDVANDFKPVSEDGLTFNGDGKTFVVADSFIGEGKEGNVSSGYAGVFLLLNSYTVWDEEFYNEYTKTEENQEGNHLDSNSHLLPLDYVMSFNEKEKDNKTIYETIEDAIRTTRKNNEYSKQVNDMYNANKDNIKYNEKAYKSLWEKRD